MRIQKLRFVSDDDRVQINAKYQLMTQTGVWAKGHRDRAYRQVLLNLAKPYRIAQSWKPYMTALWILPHEWTVLQCELSFVHRSSQQRAARHLRGPVFETVVEKNYSMPYSNFMPIIRKLLKKLRTNSICLEQFAKFTIWFVHRIEHRNILDLKISNICTPLIIGDQLWQGHIAIIRTTGI